MAETNTTLTRAEALAGSLPNLTPKRRMLIIVNPCAAFEVSETSPPQGGPWYCDQPGLESIVSFGRW